MGASVTPAPQVGVLALLRVYPDDARSGEHPPDPLGATAI
jgi:hypothetical protein